MGKKSGSGPGMNKPDHTVFPRVKKPCGCGCGWKKFGSGIRDKHPGSATLLKIPGLLTQQETEVGDKEPGLERVLPGVPHAVQRRNDHGQVGDRVPELGHVHRHLIMPRAGAVYE
jgi:hypothetical protein